jgi:putative copper resistance protein D
MSAELALFLDGLLRSFGLIVHAVSLGGFAFAAIVLRPWRAPRATPPGAEAPKSKDPAARLVPGLSSGRPAPPGAVSSCLRLAALGAAGTSVSILLQLAAKAQFIAAGMKIAPFPEFFRTQVFQVNVACAALAALMALAILWLGRRPASATRWLALGSVAVSLVLAGAWLTHGSARLEQRGLLMTLTTLHQTAGVVWVGGVVHLVSLWRLGRRDVSAAIFWPEALARFSILGTSAVAMLLAAGVPLAWVYVASWSGLVGTAYGSVLVAKWTLLAAALALAVANFRAARRWRREAAGGLASRGTRTTASAAPAAPRPFFAEVESILLVVVLFAASALAALPPAIDITEQRATFAEVVQTFAPKMPQVTSPSLAEEQAASAESAVVARQQASAEEQWSDYNHNVSGLILFAVALIALLERTGVASWARHWPLGFLVLAAFVLFRADPSGWPLAPGVGLLESFGDASWVQHKFAGFIPVALGIMEWRVRTVPDARISLRFAFPILSIVGGLLLLTHAHGAFELKAEYLTQISHTAMGLLAVLMGCGRWMEIRIDGPLGRAAGLGARVTLALIALILVFYREPLA